MNLRPIPRIALVLSALCLAAPVSAQPVGAERTAPSTALSPEAGATAVAIINDKVISAYDVQQRSRLLFLGAGIQPSAAAEAQIRTQVIRTLTDELLQQAEAKKREITVSEADVDEAVARLAQSNGVDVARLNADLKSRAIDPETLRKQMRAELSWQKLVQARYGGRIKIAPEDVDDELARIADSAKRDQYLVSEILVPIDGPDDEARARQEVNQLIEQIRFGAPFGVIAREFSQAASAAQGGDIGWIIEGQLPPEADAKLRDMRPGQVSDPIRVTGGYMLLNLREKRLPAGSAPTQAAGPPPTPAAVELVQIVIPLDGTASQERARRAATILESARGQYKDCRDLYRLVRARAPQAESQNLGVMRWGDLQPELAEVLKQAGPGGTTRAFPLPPVGVALVARCDPLYIPLQAFEMPTREQIENRMFNDEIANLARGYLRDLRRDAVIEFRAGG